MIAIDLNPLSRTAQKATITIVDNVVRAMPKLVEKAKRWKHKKEQCRRILLDFDNKKNLADSLKLIEENLSKIAEKGEYVRLGRK